MRVCKYLFLMHNLSWNLSGLSSLIGEINEPILKDLYEQLQNIKQLFTTDLFMKITWS